MDNGGKVHISYFSWTNRTLKYATNASGKWARTTVDNSGYAGEISSIAVDSSGKVHISYYEIFTKQQPGNRVNRSQTDQ